MNELIFCNHYYKYKSLLCCNLGFSNFRNSVGILTNSNSDSNTDKNYFAQIFTNISFDVLIF